MSDTQDQRHFTVEDGGSTADAAGLARSGVGHTPQRGEDAVERTSDDARVTGTAYAAGTSDDDGTTGTGHTSTDATPKPADRRSATGLDADPGHVFDQTNGVVEGLDGDSDGSAESEERDGEPVTDGTPFVEDAGVYGDAGTEEAGRTGD